MGAEPHQVRALWPTAWFCPELAVGPPELEGTAEITQPNLLLLFVKKVVQDSRGKVTEEGLAPKSLAPCLGCFSVPFSDDFQIGSEDCGPGLFSQIWAGSGLEAH